MDRADRQDPGADAAVSTVSAAELVRDAALLAGLGRRASALSDDVATALAAGTTEGQSCLGGDSPLQLTVDLPHVPGLRFGLRLPSDPDARSAAIGVLLPATEARLLHGLSATLPVRAQDPSERVGDWLFLAVPRGEGPRRASLFLELPRGLTPRDLYALTERLGLPGTAPHDALLAHARPASLRLEVLQDRVERAHLQWLLHPRRDPESILQQADLAGWSTAEPLLAELLGRRIQMRARRWLISTPLDAHSPPALRLGTSGWVLIPEGPRKQLATQQVALEHGGDLSHVQALHSLCRGTVGDRPGWRIGRAAEVRVDADQARLRLFLVPRCGEALTTDPSPPETAGTRPR